MDDNQPMSNHATKWVWTAGFFAAAWSTSATRCTTEWIQQ